MTMTCRAVFRATKCLQGRPALAVPFMMLPIRASCAMSIRPTFSQNIPSIPFTIQRASLATAEELDDGGEIKDPKIIFNLVWSKLEAQRGRESMKFPKEIIWLMGAPGSGKGTNTPFIQQVRGITSRPLVMSDLLQDPAALNLKASGQLVSDSHVLHLLLEKLLDSQYENGVIVDGFPRTRVQMECIRLLQTAMIDLRQEFFGSPHEEGFRRPKFRVAVLFVEQQESVERQLNRAFETRRHNEKVRATGVGTLLEERATDLHEEKANERYLTFKKHYDVLLGMRKHFAFSIINARQPIEGVQQEILKEFAYQSSLELGEDTFNAVERVPRVAHYRRHARQQLIRRLDNYMGHEPERFIRVLDAITEIFCPVIEMNNMSGIARVRVSGQHELFKEKRSREMAIDILTERGFLVSSQRIPHYRPVIQPDGTVVAEEYHKEYLFHIEFKAIELLEVSDQL